MGWVCITTECEIIDGVWNSQGTAVFSISDEMIQLHQKFFDFLASLTPTFILFFCMIFIIIFALAMFVSVKNILKESVRND